MVPGRRANPRYDAAQMSRLRPTRFSTHVSASVSSSHSGLCVSLASRTTKPAAQRASFKARESWPWSLSNRAFCSTKAAATRPLPNNRAAPARAATSEPSTSSFKKKHSLPGRAGTPSCSSSTPSSSKMSSSVMAGTVAMLTSPWTRGAHHEVARMASTSAWPGGTTRLNARFDGTSKSRACPSFAAAGVVAAACTTVVRCRTPSPFNLLWTLSHRTLSGSASTAMTTWPAAAARTVHKPTFAPTSRTVQLRPVMAFTLLSREVMYSQSLT
mmetsp:Transcript_57318/g.159530  ORF Transcript_57318/g.159530 Transcript_57318/m.159530 type:complete len:271 (+) Transcript_57318:38-850(+)